jgi:hypothetical protein
MRAWNKVAQLCGIVYHSTANRRPGAPRLGWPGGCPTAPPMACPRHVAPPHPAVLAHVSRGASRFSCARPARGGAHVGKAVPCGLGGPREAISGCLREAAGAELRRGRALRRGNTAPGICVSWSDFVINGSQDGNVHIVKCPLCYPGSALCVKFLLFALYTLRLTQVTDCATVNGGLIERKKL